MQNKIDSESQTKGTNPEREFLFTDKDFDKIRELIYNHAGIVLREEKRTMVYSRLGRRLRELELNTFQEYLTRLEKNDFKGDEFENLVNSLTTNLTKFFREDHHFTYLKNQVLIPYLEAYKAGKCPRRFRIWSAGCSTGQEPYTLAMTIAETPNISQLDIKVLATDIDTKVLASAKAGFYEKVEGIPQDLLKKYATPSGNGYQMNESLKRFLVFKQLNLLEPWPMSGPFDVIFCRNVVIYFDKPTQAKLFNRYADLLGENGKLFIGHSESLHHVCDRFHLVGQTIYVKGS